MRRVEVDRDRCMASGLCSFYAPATFALDEHERSVVIDPEGDPPDAIDVAVEACPTQAIQIRQSQSDRSEV